MKKYQNIQAQSLKKLILIAAIPLVLHSCKKNKLESGATEIAATGDITSKINEFRTLLGQQLNTGPGAIGGRREINWDAVPLQLLDKPLAFNFFNTPGSNVPATRQKGLVYSATSDNFMVSGDGFKSTNPETAAAFAAFSGNQIFSNVSSNLWTISFQVPGDTVAATVKGFGMVFSDVDLANSTFMEFFSGSRSLGKFFAPVHEAGSNHSFLGIRFNNEKITHIQVGHDGTLAEGGLDVSAGGQKDFVVFDDFLFDEPVKQ